MNKYFFGAVALVAVLGIGVFAAQSSQVKQAISPDKADTPVVSVDADSCSSGCCSSSKSALVSTEASKASCCSKETGEVAAKSDCCSGTATVSTEKAESGCCASSKTTTVSTGATKKGCCSGSSKTATVSTESGAKECPGVCQDGEGSKGCKLAKKEDQTENVSSTSEENEE